jgi:hypothetical protein
MRCLVEVRERSIGAKSRPQRAEDAVTGEAVVRSQREEFHEIPRPSMRPGVSGDGLPVDANLEPTEEHHVYVLHLVDNHTDSSQTNALGSRPGKY